MRRSLTAGLVLCVLSTVGLAAGPDKQALPAKTIAEELSTADTIELISLEPNKYTNDDATKDVRLFHEYRILGSLTVQPVDKFKLVRQGISDSFSDDVSIRALCFRPRHGIVAKKGEKIVCEALICFKCRVAELYDGDEFRGSISIKKGFDNKINQTLIDNKIPVDD